MEETPFRHDLYELHRWFYRLAAEERAKVIALAKELADAQPPVITRGL